MPAHDCFDALAGAVMLGEANAAERAAFDAHRRQCACCGAEAAFAAATTAALERVRDAETWRPSVVSAVLERIAKTRVRRERRTVGAFGWAIALSIVVNVAFANGITGAALSSFPTRAAESSTVATTALHLERARAPIGASSGSWRPRVRGRTPGNVGRHRRAASTPLHLVRGPRPQSAPAIPVRAADADGQGVALAPTAAAPRADESQADLLAGLDLQTRRVAVESNGCARLRELDTEPEAPEPCNPPGLQAGAATPLPR